MKSVLIRIIRLLTIIIASVMIWFLIDYFFFPGKSIDDPFSIKCLIGSILLTYIFLVLFPYRLIKKGIFKTIFSVLLITMSLVFAILFICIALFTPTIQNKDFLKVLLVMILCSTVVISNLWAFFQITKKTT